jgi:hypothetical protein
MSFDSRDYDPELADAAPAWLSRFVREDVRPLLIQHTQAALEAWDRWIACHEQRKGELTAWEARRYEYLRELLALPEEDPRRGSEPPAEGFRWIRTQIPLSADQFSTVSGWVPLDLKEYGGLAPELPLPPPSNRDLSIEECWVALLAVHDVSRVPTEKLGQTDNTAFIVLCDRAMKLTENEHLSDLKAILSAVQADQQIESPPTGMAWQDAAGRMEQLRSQGEPFTSQQELARRFGCSPATIYKAIHQTESLEIWAKRPTAAPRAQSINPIVTDRTPQRSEPDPEDDAAIREFIERADPEEKAWFLAQSHQDQVSHLNYLADHPELLNDPDKYRRRRR